MDMFVEGITPDTQILIAMGAAVAANCQPCLEKIVDLAQQNGINGVQMKGAVSIGQFIKDQPITHMKELADQLVGSNLTDKESRTACACG